MQEDKNTCCGQHDGMEPCSDPLRFTRSYRFWWRTKLAISHLRWHLRDKGFLGVIKLIIFKLIKMFGFGVSPLFKESAGSKQFRDDEVLNLQPGEWVEVKSEQEILATLDQHKRYKGLGWMCNMRKFCGQRYRVYKRLEIILLENKNEYRKVRNTVLLEGVTCDGEDQFGCDRACYHFWRELWLRRIPAPDVSYR
jgi:hypothetical protein